MLLTRQSGASSETEPYGEDYMTSKLLTLYMKLADILTQEDGQDLVEYALVVALVALGATVAMKALATEISAAFAYITSTLTSSIA
jgi:pilus assembly protein Flp/PilA